MSRSSAPAPRRIMHDGARRARLVQRHHLGRTAASPVDVARALVALHSSDPLTPFLTMWSRVPGFAIADLERAMYEERALWRLHAMRRTLFIVPTEEAPLFGAAAARGVAAAERKRLLGSLAEEMPAAEASRWLEAAEAQVTAALATAGEASTQELTALLPALAQQVTLGSGKWTQRASAIPRVLLLMGMAGQIARGRPLGTWRGSQYRWATSAAFSGRSGAYGAADEPMGAAEGEAALLERYLATHGPATLGDIRWWTGWGVKQAKGALAAVRAEGVRLDGGGEGWVLPGDRGAEPGGDELAASVALLPGLDPSTMGWKERGWYLAGPVGAAVFDRNGNAGATVWVGGRVVGAWAQRASGEVVFRLLEDVGEEAEARVAEEAVALGTWLGAAQPVRARFPSPLERELAGGAPSAGAVGESEDG